MDIVVRLVEFLFELLAEHCGQVGISVTAAHTSTV